MKMKIDLFVMFRFKKYNYLKSYLYARTQYTSCTALHGIDRCLKIIFKA